VQQSMMRSWRATYKFPVSEWSTYDLDGPFIRVCSERENMTGISGGPATTPSAERSLLPVSAVHRNREARLPESMPSWRDSIRMLMMCS